MPRTPSMTLPAVLAALALLGGAGAASAATQVGVAAAVNPDALSHLGGVTTQVVIGKDILYRERIATSKKGLVQVLFVDGSTITVGPGSDLVIDKFVYDPARGRGELSASITKGVLRFVGGRLSKNEGAVKFDTPVGTLGIRGGMFQGHLGEGEASFSFLFGDEMTFEGSNGQTNRIFEANNTLVVGGPGGGAPTIRPTRPEDAQFFVTMLSGQGGPGGGAEGPTDDQVQNSGIGGANSGDGGQGGAPQFLNNFNNLQNNENEQSTTDIIREFVQNQNNNSTPPTPQTSGSFTGFAAGFRGMLTGTENNRDFNSKPETVFTLTPSDLMLNLDAESEQMSAGIMLNDGRMPKTKLEIAAIHLANAIIESSGHLIPHPNTVYDLTFGTVDGEGDSVFSDDEHYLGTATPNGSEVVKVKYIFGFIPKPTEQPNSSHTGVLASGGLQNANPFCNACTFLRWGNWSTDVSYGKNAQQATTDSLNGWWIAGNVTANFRLPESGSATYQGSAVGNTASLSDNGWALKEGVVGRMDMEWHFGPRSGRIDISDFDGKNFGGNISAPGQVNQFAGGLSGSDGISGAATGSFVQSPTNPAAGVIGNFGVGNSTWKANGVFGGEQTSYTPPQPK